MAAKSKQSKTKSSTVKNAKVLTKTLPSKPSPNKQWLLTLIVVAGLAYLFRSTVFVAIVNNSPITRTEYNNELEKAIGQETLDNLITKKLIFQEADKMGVSIPDSEIDEEIESITNLVESQGTTLDLALESQGQTLESLKANILIQKMVEKILEDKVSVSDEEVLTYFNDNSQFYGEDANFEDLKESIHQQLLQEKLSTEFSSLLESLKTNSSIINFTDY